MRGCKDDKYSISHRLHGEQEGAEWLSCNASTIPNVYANIFTHVLWNHIVCWPTMDIVYHFVQLFESGEVDVELGRRMATLKDM